VAIDFADPSAPVITPVDFDFSVCGHALCIIDSGASHADLTDEYAAIPAELSAVCALFGKAVLRDVPEDDFYAALPRVRAAAGDRAVLRAIHIYDENRRVEAQVKALQRGDFNEFLRYVNLSGFSSQNLLQNVIPTGATAHQEVALALALARHLLNGRGACRVHGGGFAGTIQAFVPLDLLDSFRSGMEAVLGEGSCQVLSIRPEGGILLEEVEA
jgi:galactokinase